MPDLTETLDVPDGYDGGWTFTAPVVEMPVYLDWLAGSGAGGRRHDHPAQPARAAATRCGGPDVVVNCSGIGAQFLAADPTVVPGAGAGGPGRAGRAGALVARERRRDGPTYVVPRSHDIVVGGTDVEGEWSRTPSPDVASAILRRALRLVPALAGAEVLGHKVGLRPARPEVRLERVGDVVHCYGHGGAGVTLSWGCADEVVELLG